MRQPAAGSWSGRLITAAVTVLTVFTAMAGVAGTARADTPPPADCDRSQAVVALESGGPQVRAAAQAALLGSDADVCAFLASGWLQRAAVDRRVLVDQMLAAGGPAVQTAAQAALASTDTDAIDTFLDSGWYGPWQTDQRVRVDQMMATGGAQLRAAAQKALDAGTAQALTDFLDSGWQTPYATDQRIRVNQILASGGPEVQKAAQQALATNDVNTLTRFIDVGWPVAAARDEETAQISDLLATAVDAGKTAASETQAANEEAQRAVTQAAAALADAQTAAADAAAAHSDAQKAAAAAQQAADAAKNAAAAAQQALSAAAAANAAARVAAGAAARAAAAAAQTSQAAVRAQQAATAAATDATKADDARAAAVSARDVANKAKSAANAAQQAGDAAHQAAAAAAAAGDAGDKAAAAAQAAADAANDAQNAGANAAEAQAAAAKAIADASRANDAASRAIDYANDAAAAAYASRDAANHAASDADAAADAADDAAEHAGEAGQAAQDATEHADAAVAAAQASVAAAEQAQSIYTEAREADAEQLTDSFRQNDAAAQAAAAAEQTQQPVDDWNAPQAAKRSAQTNQLIAAATDPTTPRSEAVADARQVALDLSSSDGTWTRAAAIEALSGDDDEALDFVRTGIAQAEGQDDRATLAGLMATGSDAMRTAGEAALNGSDADVSAFLASEDYPGRQTEERVAVNQVIATAQADQDAVVVQRGQAALADGSDQALQAFLNTGQYDALAIDERVKVDQILHDPNSGPELQDAAQVALDGPVQFLTQFLQVGQYQAAQDDQNSAAHDAVVATLLMQATTAATTATQNALEAESAAATARGAADDAATYAQQAIAKAQEAAGYAQQAQTSANQAQTAAEDAAASAATAANAAAAADTAARNAASSAVWAKASAYHAASYADDAYRAYQDAYNSAKAAGEDTQQAFEAANEAFDAAKQQYQDEQSKWAYKILTTECTAPLVDFDSCRDNLILETEDPALYAYINGGTCQVLYQPGSTFYESCINDALDPAFGDDQALAIAAAIVTTATAWFTLESVTLAGISVGLLCSGICGAVLDAAGPLLMPELIGLPTVGLDLAAGAGATVGMEDLAGVIEKGTVEVDADEAALADLAKTLTEGCTPNSFVPGTPVLMADGTNEPINEVRIGDRVLSTDPISGTTQAEIVTNTITGSGEKQLVDVTVDADGEAGNATVTVTATDGHPFWVPDLREWVDAGNLRAGQWLRTSSGTRVQVTAVRHHAEHATVRNLTVASQHTYYVAPGGTPLLVHNASCGVTIGLGKASYGLVVKADNDGAWNLMSLGSTEWQPFLEEAIKEAQAGSDITFRFYMDGITAARLGLPQDATLEQRVNAFADLGDTGRGGYTALEMSMLRKAGMLPHNTVFVEGGVELPNPFADE